MANKHSIEQNPIDVEAAFRNIDAMSGVVPEGAGAAAIAGAGGEVVEAGPSEDSSNNSGSKSRMHIELTPDKRSWQDEGNCLGTDPDLFFPERGASTREAKEVCRGCVVRLDCLEYALDNGEKFGIWGGLSERERRRLRRQRAQANRRTTA